MIVGYARTSTVEQHAGFEAQVRELEACHVEKIFSEQVSSVQQRAELASALYFVREGDTFIVTKLDRLARSVRDLHTIVDELLQKNVTLRILNLGLDTSTPTGRLMLNLMGSFAEFEREIMLERQREGIAKARANNKYNGRPRNSARDTMIREQLHAGRKPAQIARDAGVHPSTVYRIKKSL